MHLELFATNNDGLSIAEVKDFLQSLIYLDVPEDHLLNANVDDDGTLVSINAGAIV